MIGRPARALEALIPGITTLLSGNLVPSTPFEIEAKHPTLGALALEVRTAPVDLPDGTGDLRLGDRRHRPHRAP